MAINIGIVCNLFILHNLMDGKLYLVRTCFLILVAP